ncbi:L-2-hydroxyglutarate dehydrogenase, mitochondrial [Culicoides brevitarsis]|uniref:L-2-hydroxyglutarate dehydrogenase, mitochondrial n=1 Tax=Culicoides brevitarsis TaxID=469753 RepID=UPI00307C6320
MSLLLRNSSVITRFENALIKDTARRFFASRSLGHDRDNKYDLVVVGGGIVGVASAREIMIRHPKLRVAILEKEKSLAVHQSGHNSGVIHAGIYYKPGSLKAKLCVEGLRRSYKYLEEKKIPYKKVGKLIVATNELEVKRLKDLEERGKANEVPGMQVIDGDQIQEIEPYCIGLKAIWSPETGIVDWAQVCRSYGKDFTNSGGDIHLNFEAQKFVETVGDADHPVTILGNDDQRVSTKYVLTCGGLQADLLAKLTGCSPTPKIVPFRGEYLLLNPEKAHMVKGNIYPVPDPRFPFLGVHFTPRMDGSIWLGPNAVFALRREGYKWTDINLKELFESVTYPGFLRLSARFILPGLQEAAKSLITPLQVADLRKYIPDIMDYDVMPGPSGVRAQALSPEGELVDDFVFDQGSGESPIAKQVLHCRNAPSPGATSSLAIARNIADRIDKDFRLE